MTTKTFFSILLRGLLSVNWKLRKKAQKILSREKGAVFKDPGGRVTVCLVYPNAYALGMSNLGFQSVYRLFNSLEQCVCERAFLPDDEDADELSRSGTPLFSLESQRPLKAFDIVAFSLPFEEDYLNIPKILGLAGIPLSSKARDENSPLVIAGGIGPTLNPEPIAEMVDLVIVGEGEGAVKGFLECYVRAREARGGMREGLLRGLDTLPFIYVPSLYEFVYDGVRVAGRRPLKGAKPRVRAMKNLSLEGFPLPGNSIRTPDTVFKDTALVEIERGCGRGCRFCAAGFVCLPPRPRETGAVMEAVKAGAGAAPKVGLVGTAVSEYPALKEVLGEGIRRSAAMTLSSLRMDVLDPALAGLLKEAGYRTVTLAPEAGSERMRSCVNKGMSEGDILESVRIVSEAGFRRLKLYFLIGLPGETDQDAREVAGLTLKIRSIFKKGFLTLSINPFIPKPSTPFQWSRFEDISILKKRLALIKKDLAGARGVSIKAMPPAEAFFQTYISRADRRAGALIEKAGAVGMRRALKADREFIEASVYRERGRDEILPWDIIDHGINKDYLWKEFQKGLKGRLTEPCHVGSCFRCGVCGPEAFNGRNSTSPNKNLKAD